MLFFSTNYANLRKKIVPHASLLSKRPRFRYQVRSLFLWPTGAKSIFGYSPPIPNANNSKDYSIPLSVTRKKFDSTTQGSRKRGGEGWSLLKCPEAEKFKTTITLSEKLKVTDAHCDRNSEVGDCGKEIFQNVTFHKGTNWTLNGNDGIPTILSVLQFRYLNICIRLLH